jgi:hypothetical protein
LDSPFATERRLLHLSVRASEIRQSFPELASYIGKSLLYKRFTLNSSTNA